MDRTTLFNLAAGHGWKVGQPLDPATAELIRGDLATTLTDADLAAAPRVYSPTGMRPMTVDEAIELLMEELQ